MTGKHPEGCPCGLHKPASEARKLRISIGLQLHYEAKGVSDGKRQQQQRDWYRRNKAKVARRRSELG